MSMGSWPRSEARREESHCCHLTEWPLLTAPLAEYCKIAFTDEHSEMLQNEMVSVRAVFQATVSHKNRHPKVVVVKAVVDNNIIGVDID